MRGSWGKGLLFMGIPFIVGGILFGVYLSRTMASGSRFGRWGLSCIIIVAGLFMSGTGFYLGHLARAHPELDQMEFYPPDDNGAPQKKRVDVKTPLVTWAYVDAIDDSHRDLGGDPEAASRTTDVYVIFRDLYGRLAGGSFPYTGEAEEGGMVPIRYEEGYQSVEDAQKNRPIHYETFLIHNKDSGKYPDPGPCPEPDEEMIRAYRDAKAR